MMNTVKFDSVRHVDTIQRVDNSHLQVQQAKQQTQADIKSVDLNETDLAMVEQAALTMNNSEDVDMDRVLAMKEKIANGEMQFDMGELARSLFRG